MHYAGYARSITPETYLTRQPAQVEQQCYSLHIRLKVLPSTAFQRKLSFLTLIYPEQKNCCSLCLSSEQHIPRLDSKGVQSGYANPDKVQICFSEYA